MKAVMRIQNIYVDFLKSFTVFIDRVTRNLINKYEFNWSSKTIEYYKMMQEGETFEFPVAIIEIQDLQPEDGVSPIARSARMDPFLSPHNSPIAWNYTRNEKIILDKRWVNLTFTVTINTEDVAQGLNIHDYIIGNLPMNFYFYDYKYWNYIEVTDAVKDWDFTNDNIENVFLRTDATYQYEPEVGYKESNEDFFKSKERDRSLGRDAYPSMEGVRYFAAVEQEPYFRVTGVQKVVNKETMQNSIVVSIEAKIEVPNMLMWFREYDIEKIEITIDTTSSRPQEYPILIDVPENFLVNKNVSRGILLTPESFIFPDDALYDVPDDGTEPDPEKYAHLVVNEYIPLGTLVASLWAVEDVTITSSSRFFIPLKHAKIVYDKDDNGEPFRTRFFFKEMEWLEHWDFGNPMLYTKIILFSDEN